MQDAVNENFIGFYLEENTIISRTQAIAGLKLDKPLDIPVQIIAGEAQLLDDASLLLFPEISEIFLSARSEFDLVLHMR